MFGETAEAEGRHDHNHLESQDEDKAEHYEGEMIRHQAYCRGQTTQEVSREVTQLSDEVIMPYIVTSYLRPVTVILGGHIDTVPIHGLYCRILEFIYDTAGSRHNLEQCSMI